jgi:hypothetical protein
MNNSNPHTISFDRNTKSQPSTLRNLVPVLVRNAQDLRDLANRVKAIVPALAQAGQDEIDVLRAVLTGLGVAPDADPEDGKDFESIYKTAGEQLGHVLRAAAGVAIDRQALLVAQTKADPRAVAVLDFGSGGVHIRHQDDAPPERAYLAYGLYNRLPVGHVLKTLLTPADCPTAGEEPIVLLGRPVQSFDGRMIPAPSYPVKQAEVWTLEAGRHERDQAERYRLELEAHEQELKEKYKTPTELEVLRKEVARLKELLDPLRVEHDLKALPGAVKKFRDTRRAALAKLAALPSDLDPAVGQARREWLAEFQGRLTQKLDQLDGEIHQLGLAAVDAKVAQEVNTFAGELRNVLATWPK